MTVTYKGLDCLNDMDTSAYAMYAQESQTQVPWAYQAHYGKVTVYFGVATIFVACVKHLWFRFKDKRYASGHRGPSGLFSSLIYVITGYCRLLGYLPTPSILTEIFSFPASVGNLLFAMLTSGYLLCYCLIPHFWYRACFGFGSPPLSVRAGIMAASLVPFIFVLSGKSNVISMLTGIGYEKLNWIHQFVSVAMLVLAIIHAIPFIHQALAEGGLANLAVAFEDPMHRSGIPALVLLILLCTMFRKEIRKQIYELSFHFHWMMGCAFFGILMVHVYDMLDMQNYLWVTLALWMAQLLYRGITSGVTRPRNADICKLDENTFEISIYDIGSLKWLPGQHCLLRFPGGNVADNHPFSIASVKEEEHLKFIVAPQKGLTKKMFELLETAVIKKKVLVNGPYGGTTRDVSGFDKVMLFATGNGVSVTLPYLTAIAQNQISAQEANFVWIVKDIQALDWIRDELQRVVDIAKGRITIDIYCVTSDPKFEKFDIISGAKVYFGKPNILEVGRRFQKSLRRRNLIVSSGSLSMRRSISSLASEFQATIFNANPTHPYVEEVCLHSEMYGW